MPKVLPEIMTKMLDIPSTPEHQAMRIHNRSKPVDQKCFALATYFLQNEPINVQQALALEIQDTVESFSSMVVQANSD